PVWDGFWTGLSIKKIITMRVAKQERCFAFVVADGKNQLWELSRNAIYDGDNCRIRSVIETRSHGFSSIYAARRLEGLELWIDNLQGDVDWDVKFRSDRF